MEIPRLTRRLLPKLSHRIAGTRFKLSDNLQLSLSRAIHVHNAVLESGVQGAIHAESSLSASPHGAAGLISHQSSAPLSHAGPRGPHVLTSSPDLRRRRQEQQAAAQELTSRLTACASVSDALQLYESHSEHFNAIHFSALFTVVARLADPDARADLDHDHSAPHRQPQQPLSSRSRRGGALGRRSLSRSERASLRRYVSSRLLPHVGLRLMGFGPRQLVSVLGALARLRVAPPAFWLAEWLQLFGRRVEASAQAPGGRLDGPGATPCSPRDMAQAMWALARLQGCAGEEAVAAAAAGASGTMPSPQIPSRDSQSSSGVSDHLADGGRHAGHAALASVAGPSHVWLAELSAAFAAQAPALSAPDLSAYLWAAARLGYRPSEPVMQALLGRCGELLGRAAAAPGDPRVCHGGSIGPRELSVILWALATMGFHPGAAWLERACAAAVRLAGGPAFPEAREVVPALQAAPPAHSTTPSADSAAAPPAAPPHQGAQPSPSDGDWWQQHLTSDASAPAAVHPPSPASPRPFPSPQSQPLLDSRQAATCAWALVRLRHRPQPAAVRALLAHARPLLPGAAPRDLSMLLWALGTLRYRPEPALAAALLAATAGRMGCGSASPQDLVVWATALSRLRLAVPVPWARLHLAAAEEALEALPPLALVNWMAALAHLQTSQPRWRAPVLRPVGRGGAGRHVTAGSRPDRRVALLPGRALAAPPLGARRPEALAAAAHAAGGAGAAPAAVAPAAPGTYAATGVRVHHATRHVHSRVFRRLAALSAAQLGAMDLPLLSRCAWAAAKLHMAPRGGWLAAVVARAEELLERQGQGAERGAGLGRGSGPQLGAEPPALPAAQGVPPVGAAWAVKLVWAVAALTRQAGKVSARQRLRAARLGAAGAVPEARGSRRPPPRLLQARAAVGSAAPAGPQPPVAVGEGAPALALVRRPMAASPCGDTQGQTPRFRRRLVPVPGGVRWLALLLSALLPQLPSLSNRQLVRLTYGVAVLLGASAPRDARPGPGGAVLRGRRALAVRSLGAYCRRRVEATCGGGGEEACDVDTARLLQCSRGFGGGEEREA